MAYEKKKKQAPKTEKTEDEKILEQARNRLKSCIEDEEDERKLMLDDLKFSTLDQWPDAIRRMREHDPNGPRPCLTSDKLNQYLIQVVNDARINRPGVKVRAIDDESDPDTARVFQEAVRHIEDQSTAQIAYMGGIESAARIGLGYFRVVTDYEAPDSFDQEILIRRVPNTFACYLGPHVMPDGSDAQYGFIFEEMHVERFKREFPNAKNAKGEFETLPEGVGAFWRSEDMIVVCEYFYFEEERTDLLFLKNGMTMYAKDWEALPDDQKMPVEETRSTVKKKVRWCKHTGVEILEKQDWAGKFIPIIEVVGKEAFVEGKRKLWGLVRPAKDPLRAYNYWLSTVTEKIGLAPKAPFILAEGQIEGYESIWAKANVENRAYLPYKPVDVNNNAVPAPKRQEPSQVEAGMMSMLQVLERDVQTALGMFKASVGEAESQQSGRAILALQRESDTSTHHFPDNLALSIAHCGRILIDLIPKIYDTKRMLRLLGEDGEAHSVIIDPEQKEAKRDIRTQEGVKRIYNLNVGKYDVTVTVGPSYNTKRAEQAEAMMEMLKSQPQLIGVVGDLMFKSMDWPMAEKIAERLQKMLPPQLADQPEGEEPVPPAAQQKMAQMQQALQVLGQKGAEMQQELEKAKSGENAKMAQVQVKAQEAQAELALKAKVQAEELRLAREKAEADFALRKWQAEQEAGLNAQRAEFEREQKAKDDAVALETKQKEEAGTAVPQFAQMMGEVLKTFGAALDRQAEFHAQLVEAIRNPAPREIKLGGLQRDNDGRLIGASATSQTVQ